MGLREEPESREESHGHFVAIRREMEETRSKLLESEERVVMLQNLIEQIKQSQRERVERAKRRSARPWGRDRGMA